MKQLVASFVSLALVGNVFVSPVFAQSPSPTPVSEQAPQEYVLPYPGILPDHPLYFLKALRDRILEALIVDPQRKAEFYLLQADKRLNMGIFFDAKGIKVKAAESITIAEEFMAKSIDGLFAFKNAGSVVPASMVDRLEKSTAKHIEVLETMLINAAEAEKVALSAALEKVKELQARLTQLK